jgi:urease accessory protein UreF
MLSESQITAYQRLFRNRFGEEISREEANERGTRLMRIVELVYKPMTEAEYQQAQDRRKETGDL